MLKSFTFFIILSGHTGLAWLDKWLIVKKVRTTKKLLCELDRLHKPGNGSVQKLGIFNILQKMFASDWHVAIWMVFLFKLTLKGIHNWISQRNFRELKIFGLIKVMRLKKLHNIYNGITMKLRGKIAFYNWVDFFTSSTF